MADEPYAVVRGWRAFYFAACYKHEDPVWCLKGGAGMHLHSNPAPRALHRMGSFRPDWVQQGIEEHEYGPVFGCGCGHYGLFRPNIYAATGMAGLPYIPIVWAEITALGPTVLHEDSRTGDSGFRCESYQVDRLFWPCADKDLMTTMAGDREAHSGSDRNEYAYYQASRGPIGELLPAIAKDLGVELVLRPVGLWLQERRGLEDLISSASAALEEKP